MKIRCTYIKKNFDFDKTGNCQAIAIASLQSYCVLFVNAGTSDQTKRTLNGNLLEMVIIFNFSSPFWGSVTNLSLSKDMAFTPSSPLRRWGKGHLKFGADIEQTLSKDFKWMRDAIYEQSIIKQGKPCPMNMMILLTFGFAPNRSMKAEIVEAIKLWSRRKKGNWSYLIEKTNKFNLKCSGFEWVLNI